MRSKSTTGFVMPNRQATLLVVWVALASAIGCATRAPHTGAPSAGNLAVDILYWGEDYAGNRGYSVGVNLRPYAVRAANDIEQLPEDLQWQKIETVKANFEVLVAAMIRAADHPGVIGEESLANALLDICPLWPFCD